MRCCAGVKVFVLLGLLGFSLWGCAKLQQAHLSSKFDGAGLDRLVPQLMAQEKVAGVGVGVIRDGTLIWQGYYGEQSPGIAISADTMFNTASIAKTITAEVLIALSGQQMINIDEPIAERLTHPDLSADARYQQLTARLLMGHRAGLLNWAYEYADGRLAFDHDPDTRFSYSGAGVELAARYAEQVTGATLADLAREHVLDPAGMAQVAMGMVPSWARERVPTPMDEQGVYRSIDELNPSLAAGDANSAADDLLVTVPAYASLIEWLLQRNGPAYAQENRLRLQVVTSQQGDAIYHCPTLQWLTCPEAYGHSFGWSVFRYPDHHVLMHSGSDAGENAFVYFSPETGAGAVIFVNGANGWFVMTRIIEQIGDEPMLADYYRALIITVMGRDMPPLEDS